MVCVCVALTALQQAAVGGTERVKNERVKSYDSPSDISHRQKEKRKLELHRLLTYIPGVLPKVLMLYTVTIQYNMV